MNLSMKRRLDLYRPSSGTEGMSFMEDFCCKCFHERAMTNPKGEGKACSIVGRAMAFEASVFIASTVTYLTTTT